MKCSYLNCSSSTTPEELQLRMRQTATKLSGELEEEGSRNLSQKKKKRKKKTRSSLNRDESMESLVDKGISTGNLKDASNFSKTSSLANITNNINSDSYQTALSSNESILSSSRPKSTSKNPPSKIVPKLPEQGPQISQTFVIENLEDAPLETQQALIQVLKSQQLVFRGYRYATPELFTVIVIYRTKEENERTNHFTNQIVLSFLFFKLKY